MRATQPTRSTNSRSAVFSSPGLTYHADRCEPLREAVRRGELRLQAFARRGYPGRPLPSRMLPEISTVGFWDATVAQSWGLDWHRNEGIELTYLARGGTEFLVENERFALESGHLTITRPWQRHRVGNPRVGPSRLCWLILDVGVRRPDQAWSWPRWLVSSPADLRRLTTLLSHHEQPVWRANDEIAACFEKLAGLVQQGSPASVQSRIQLYISELFIALRELIEQRNVNLNADLTSTRRSVEIFLNSLHEHLDHPWTLEEMAEHCGLRPSAFTDYCRRILNLTPARHLARLRMDAARRMLSASAGASVTEVALSCGFQTSQYFATVFHKNTGLSPRAWRAKHQGTKL